MPKRNPILAAFSSERSQTTRGKRTDPGKPGTKARVGPDLHQRRKARGRNVSMLSIARIAKALGTSIAELSRDIEK